jgi:hypothetical protein
MSGELNPHEKCVAKEQSPLCDKFVAKDDLIFSYPIEFLDKNYAETVADTLQRAMDYLGYLTGKNPTRYFNSRVVIRWMRDHEKTGNAYWKSEKTGNGHWVDLSWDYMSQKDEPYKICAHELVHPFYRISPLHTKGKSWGGNEGWGEGFCEFLRAPVMHRMGLDGKGWWRRVIDAAARSKSGTHENPAGQFVKLAQEKCWSGSELNEFVDWFIDNKQAIKDFVSSLFEVFADRPLRRVLVPTAEMIKKYGNKGML